MSEIDQSSTEKICDGVVQMKSGSAILVDKQQEHPPVEMLYQGIHGEDIEGGPFFVFECPTCGRLQLA
jgi:hypothetical protein